MPVDNSHRNIPPRAHAIVSCRNRNSCRTHQIPTRHHRNQYMLASIYPQRSSIGPRDTNRNLISIHWALLLCDAQIPLIDNLPTVLDGLLSRVFSIIPQLGFGDSPGVRHCICCSTQRMKGSSGNKARLGCCKWVLLKPRHALSELPFC